MIIIETFERWYRPRAPPPVPVISGRTLALNRHDLSPNQAVASALRPAERARQRSESPPLMSRGH